ncbi:hypothetical protein SLE2022_170700 [Rubroshorea leprosula]
MTSATAIFLIPLLILVLFATAATAAAPSTSSSVEVSEANRKCSIPIHGNCPYKYCCWDLCEKQIRYAKTVDAAYRSINGAHQCFCTVIYNDKPGPCP